MMLRFAGASVFGPFGATATAGKLLELDEERLANAVDYTANLASGLTECWIVNTIESNTALKVAGFEMLAPNH